MNMNTFVIFFVLETIVVMATSLWVYFDAQTIGVEKGQSKGIFDLSAGQWAMGVFIVWIICFPAYMVKRSNTNASITNKNARSYLETIACDHLLRTAGKQQVFSAVIHEKNRVIPVLSLTFSCNSY